MAAAAVGGGPDRVVDDGRPRLAPFAALAVLWIAGGLWYRVLEIPNVARVA